MAEPTTPPSRSPSRPPAPAVEEPLATGPLGMALLAFKRVPEETRFSDAQLTYALVTLWRAGRLLLVHVRQRDCWELPGGGIDPGETPREAAARELHEEAGQVIAPADLRFVGFARTSLPRLSGPSIRYGALYTAQITGTATPAEAAPFEPTWEIGATHWWDPSGPPPPGGQLQTVDAYLAERAR